mmetsp:Transcript_35589/g.62881  ORF Transcript_35589/g.62881 Transcript_35589/m.62881 type:complete len:223 (+) Transcript_35589:510-1178(+)
MGCADTPMHVIVYWSTFYSSSLSHRNGCLKHHAYCCLILSVELIIWSILIADIAWHRVIAATINDLSPLARKIYEVLHGLGRTIRANAGRQSCKICSMHTQRICKDESLEVTVRVHANHLLNLVKLISSEICQQTQGLDDHRDFVQLFTLAQVQRFPGHALDDILFVFTSAPCQRQKSHITNAKSAVAGNCGTFSVLARIRLVGCPRIHEISCALVKRDHDV